MMNRIEDTEIQRLLAMIKDTCDTSTRPLSRAAADARDILTEDEQLLRSLNALLASELGRASLASIVQSGIRDYLLHVSRRIDEGSTPVRLAIKLDGQLDTLSGCGLYDHLIGFFMDD